MKTKKRRISTYWFVLIAIVLVNAIIIAITLNWLHKTLEDYEAHTPRRALDLYFTRLAAKDYEDIRLNAGFMPGVLSSWEDYFTVLEARFSGVLPEELSYRKTASADIAPDEELYSIYRGEEKLGEVVLFPDADSATSWSVRALYDYLPGYTVVAPANTNIMVNDLFLHESSATETTPVYISYMRDGRTVEVDIFSAMDDPGLAPKMVHYATEETLLEPSFTATDDRGNDCVVEVDRENRTVIISFKATKEEEAAHAALMEEVSKAYSDFITKDGTLAALRPYLFEDTSLYRDYSAYQADWYIEHDRREFSDVSVSDIRIHSGSTFTGHIEFTVRVIRGSRVHVFRASYDMAFIRVEDEWFLAGMHARHSDPPVEES